MANYVNSSVIGVNFANVDAVGAPTFNQGTVVNGSQDSLFVYCETTGTFTTGMLGTISTGGTATPAVVSAGQSAANGVLGFIQSATTSGQFAWFCQRGLNVYIAVSGTVSASAQMYVSTVLNGVLSSTSASSTMGGVQMLASVSSTATQIAVLANLTWPRFLTVTM